MYEQTARTLQKPNAALARLATPARRTIENAYATIEITDSIAQRGAHQVALGRGLAPGPANTFWGTTSAGLVRTDGVTVALVLPDCGQALAETRLARSSDGTLWLADVYCARLIHLSAEGVVLSVTQDAAFTNATRLAPDLQGGVWAAAAGAEYAVHVDAAGVNVSQ